MRKEKLELEALFVCYTPLQMLITQSIIDQNDIQKYGIILIAQHNEKYEYYFSKIVKKAIFSFKYSLNPELQKFYLLRAVKSFRKKLTEKLMTYLVKDIYVSSINNLYIQSLVFHLNFENLYTFDDGLANIYSKSLYYKDDDRPKWKRYIWNFLERKYSTKDIRNLSKQHFTIYPNNSNIIENVKVVNLITDDYMHKDGFEEINIFLGQPIYEVNPIFNDTYIENVIKELDIKYYFPHPREHYKLPASINIIESELIFEDYIIQLYKNSSYKKINVYSFFSSCMLNIQNLPFVEVNLIRLKGVDSRIYEVFEENNIYNFITIE